MNNDDIDFLERTYSINIDETDDDGCTHVYTYTESGQRVGFTFNTMSPAIEDLRTAAIGIDNLRTVANKGLGEVDPP